MNTLYKNNQPAITNPDWSFRVTIAAGEVFDGTDNLNDPRSVRIGTKNGGKWPWGDGFLIKPTTDLTDLPIIPYAHYHFASLDDMTDALASGATTENFVADVWNETRVIYIDNSSGTSSVIINIGA